tara:strand:+ start:2991 stop:3191 length:201 start_codon:yes stop_codon:yes gene_type:complete
MAKVDKNIKDYKKLRKEAEKPTIKSSIESLKIQLKEYTDKEEYFKIMKIKAQGAIEILTELDAKNG